METQVNYTAVGAFVIVLVLFIILAIIWMSAGLSVESYRYYKVVMDEPISGVAIDSPVEFNGVEVGYVHDIRIDRHSPQCVIVLLKIKSSVPVTQGTVAKLSLRGITGQAYIGLIDKGEDVRPLLPPQGEKYAVIKTGPSTLLRLEKLAIKVAAGLEKMTNAVSALLNKENQLLFRKILNNTSTATEALTPLFQQTKRTINVLETKTLPNANEAFSNFGSASRDISHVSRNLRQISNEIKQNPAVIIRGKAERRLGPGE